MKSDFPAGRHSTEEAGAREEEDFTPTSKQVHHAQLMMGALGSQGASGTIGSTGNGGSHDSSLGDEDSDVTVPSVPASLRPRYGSVHFNTLREAERPNAAAEALNEKAVKVISRVQNKLTGRDFDVDQILSVPDQVWYSFVCLSVCVFVCVCVCMLVCLFVRVCVCV